MTLRCLACQLALTACVGRGWAQPWASGQAPWRAGMELAWKLESTVILDASKGITVAKKRLLVLQAARSFGRGACAQTPEPGLLTLSAAVWLCDLEQPCLPCQGSGIPPITSGRHMFTHSFIRVHSFIHIHSFICPTGISQHLLPRTEMSCGKS